MALGEPAAFWKQTPRLLDLAVRGRLKAAKRERDQRIIQAYQTAVLGRVKEMPKLSDLLANDTGPKPPQTPEVIQTAVRQWIAAAAFGRPEQPPT